MLLRPLRAFLKEEEEVIVHHLIVVAQWGFPYSNIDLRLLVKGYLEKNGREVNRFKDNTPGKEWAHWLGN